MLSRFNFLRSALRVSSVAVIAICLFSGCSGDTGYDISGNVSFDGKPIPAGQIYFRPDGSKSATGTTGYANIVDGKYDTALEGGKPMPGGPTVIAIEGLDPNGTADVDDDDTSGEVLVASLFPTYEIKMDLPSEQTTKDFEVPAEAADVKYAPERVGGGGP